MSSIGEQMKWSPPCVCSAAKLNGKANTENSPISVQYLWRMARRMCCLCSVVWWKHFCLHIYWPVMHSLFSCQDKTLSLFILLCLCLLICFAHTQTHEQWPYIYIYRHIVPKPQIDSNLFVFIAIYEARGTTLEACLLDNLYRVLDCKNHLANEYYIINGWRFRWIDLYFGSFAFIRS